ncbi:MAG: DUF5317 family protein [Eubacteriales bacterium]|nr:DUF5317 family protein [Eubacteriales bacterium]
MIHTAAIVGLLIGLIRKGSLYNLAEHKIRLVPVLVMSFACELMVMSGLLHVMIESDDLYITLRLLVSALQYVLVLIFLIVNALKITRTYAKYSLYSIAVGSILNAAVILSNLGRMPVSTLIIEHIPWLSGAPLDRLMSAPHYILANENTRLVLLGDCIPFWSFGWYMVSPGDFLISAGLIMFAYWLTQNPHKLKPKNLEHKQDIVYTNGR